MSPAEDCHKIRKKTEEEYGVCESGDVKLGSNDTEQNLQQCVQICI